MPTLNQGFTLLEVVIYTALIVGIGLTVTGFMFRLGEVNARAAATSQALDDARQALSIITHEVRHAESVYDPTSVFGSHPGQLSLETSQGAPADHPTHYIDFYVDDERLYVKREGEAAQLITSERVRITNLTFTHLDAASSQPAVRIELTAEPEGGVEHSIIHLYATATLRSYD